MIKTVRFFNGKTQIVLEVENCFEYTYNAMKTVLKLTILESKQSYDTISELKKCEGRIAFYEDEDFKTDYEGYNLGAKGFTANYMDGIFNIELAKESSYSVRLDKIEETLDFVLEFLAGGSDEPEDEEVEEETPEEEQPQPNDGPNADVSAEG